MLTFFGQGGASLDVPGPVLDLHQLQVLEDLLGLEGELQVLLVGVDEQGHLGEALFAQKRLQLFDALAQSLFVTGVDHEYHAVGVVVVILPVGPDGLLATDVPHVELEAVLGLLREGKQTLLETLG